MLTLAGDEGESEEIDPAHLPEALESLAEAKRREFASDARGRSRVPPLDKASLHSARDRESQARLCSFFS
jgi:hypothetical protein